MSNAVIAAAQSRLAAAFPTWRDSTGDPHPTPEKKLPAFRVAVTYTSSERVGMGDERHWREGQLEVTIETEADKDETAAADIHAVAGLISAAITATPADLDGTCWEINPDGFEADHDGGKDRVSRGDMIFAIQTLE